MRGPVVIGEASIPVVVEFLRAQLLRDACMAQRERFDAFDWLARDHNSSFDWSVPANVCEFQALFKEMLADSYSLKKLWEESGLTILDVIGIEQDSVPPPKTAFVILSREVEVGTAEATEAGATFLEKLADLAA